MSLPNGVALGSVSEGSLAKNHSEESLTVKSITTMMSTEVHHVGMASEIQSMAAVTKMATMRCSTSVRPGKPYHDDGIAMMPKYRTRERRLPMTVFTFDGLRKFL